MTIGGHGAKDPNACQMLEALVMNHPLNALRQTFTHSFHMAGHQACPPLTCHLPMSKHSLEIRLNDRRHNGKPPKPNVKKIDAR